MGAVFQYGKVCKYCHGNVPRTQAEAGYATLRSGRTAVMAWRGRSGSARACCGARDAGGCGRVTVRTGEARPWEQRQGAENRHRRAAVSRARAAPIWPAQNATAFPRRREQEKERGGGRPGPGSLLTDLPPVQEAARSRPGTRPGPSASGPEALPARRWGPGSRAPPGRGTYV